MPTSTTTTFTSPRGNRLHARLERPDGPVRAAALFAHCFTCSKDLRVERQLTSALSGQGLAVLSFDFTGLGRSDGQLAGFAADVADLVAAATHLGEVVAPPSLLVGHSLGGAAVLSAAPRIAGVRSVATIGAPADPVHVLGVVDGDLEAVRRDGSGTVRIGGRAFTLSRTFLEQLTRGTPRQRLREFAGATLLLHSSADEVVGIENAELLYRAAQHPKSFVSLDRADHLVTDPRDAGYVAAVVATWADRYLPDPTPVG